jgi:transcriptional regulator with XRE-family HTH domain
LKNKSYSYIMKSKQNNHVEVGEQLKGYRKKKHLSLRDVADLVNISFSLISKHERGDRPLTAMVFVKLSKLYGLSYSQKAKMLNMIGDAITDAAYFEAMLSVMAIESVEGAGVAMSAIKGIVEMPPKGRKKVYRIDLKGGSDVTVTVGIKR